MPLMQPLRSALLTIGGRSQLWAQRRLARTGCAALLLCAVTACATTGGTGAPARDDLGSDRAAEQADAAAAGVLGVNGAARQRSPTLGGGTLGTTIELADTAWSGGYPNSDVSTPSGGIATAVYGAATQYNMLQASFVVEAQPFGAVELSLEGIDFPGATNTPIVIAINDHEIYNGPNPLPDGDLSTQLDAWGSYTWRFNAQMLHPGQNVITIRNLADSALDQAPFFMLDYAELTYQAQ